MTRRRSLTEAQIRQIREMYKPGKVGYESISKATGIPVSTVRDHVKYWVAYSS